MRQAVYVNLGNDSETTMGVLQMFNKTEGSVNQQELVKVKITKFLGIAGHCWANCRQFLEVHHREPENEAED